MNDGLLSQVLKVEARLVAQLPALKQDWSVGNGLRDNAKDTRNLIKLLAYRIPVMETNWGLAALLYSTDADNKVNLEARCYAGNREPQYEFLRKHPGHVLLRDLDDENCRDLWYQCEMVCRDYFVIDNSTVVLELNRDSEKWCPVAIWPGDYRTRDSDAGKNWQADIENPDILEMWSKKNV